MATLIFLRMLVRPPKRNYWTARKLLTSQMISQKQAAPCPWFRLYTASARFGPCGFGRLFGAWGF